MTRITKLGSGDWYFEWSCANCLDSGIAVAMFGPERCQQCNSYLNPLADKLAQRLTVLLVGNKEIESQLLTMARVLVSATAENPIQGEALASLLECDAREVKRLAKRLRDEWHLPVAGSREKPFGYYYAATPEQFLEWMRTTRSQAISELATAYHLFKSNFPALAGQQSLEFVNQISTELQEAIR